MASSRDYYTYLPTQWEDYFSGVLENLGDTEYLCYCYREYYDNSSYNYTDNYVLIYGLEFDTDGELINGTYPCIEILKDNNSSSGYYSVESMISSVPVPDIGYGSFGVYSDLREGVGHSEAYALLFALGVSIVFRLVDSLFSTVLRLGKRES